MELIGVANADNQKHIVICSLYWINDCAREELVDSLHADFMKSYS